MTLYKMSHIQGANYHVQQAFRSIVSSNSRIGGRQYCYSDLKMKKKEKKKTNRGWDSLQNVK